jgi:hypothetical protein
MRLKTANRTWDVSFIKTKRPPGLLVYIAEGRDCYLMK